MATLPQLVSVSVILHHHPLEGHPLELWKGQSKVGLVAEEEEEEEADVEEVRRRR